MAEDDMPIIQPSEYHVPATNMTDLPSSDIDQGHSKLSVQEQYKAYKPLMKLATAQGKDKAKAGLEFAGSVIKDKLDL